ncbi:NAD-dependent deacetylase [Acetobacter aceti NRIC 0242]|uniref:NAD-dependent protein deacylase n=1 Tax=Acetobacter aceti NBRC 14818 TaxID=887700 RepID=A0AB33IAG6_ACEAC|nr:NAD-dependent deacylase [Acetobacter aceti]TCS33588.1 NAD-dependent deacetylase [Acetobacter aceti NBRC 14818]BCK74846.1 NAD-dependent protein deacylase [Acetobacter aceti NBRC 14818]GAN57193.1 NAD dependent deacetylase [Acetobacter aceti NBRC 14818]GBO80886.1 NAD-dependent deacetylase [Acetobacter aceti NRIC 0242]
MERIVILTGAGISRESGLATFRDEAGVWSRVRLEDVCTPEGFARNPDQVDAFYNHRRQELQHVAPNAAHRALAELEQAYGANEDDAFLLITQNIDDLHERAGSHNVVHMHGELLQLRCLSCGATPTWHQDCTRATACPECGAQALRPDVVWFGEMPLHMEGIMDAIARCDCFVAIGTSATVYPAAGFTELATNHAHTVELNLAPSGKAGLFDEAAYGPATSVVPRFVKSRLAAETS